MNGNNQIIIEACANGFVVTFPQVINIYAPGGEFFNGMIEAGKAIRKGQMGDDIMEKIREESKDPVQTKQDTAIEKASNQHVFGTFKEVLAFLNYKMID